MAASQLLAQLRDWLASLPREVRLTSAESPSATPRQGETPLAAIQRVRQEIDARRSELARIRSAPRPRTDIVAELRERVHALAARGRPRLDAPPADRPDAVSLACWLDPERVIARLESELPGDAGDAVTAARSSSDVAAELLELERQEESLVEQAQHVDRRWRASPLAVLGLTVVSPTAARSAA
jgi:hypothetical protein